MYLLAALHPQLPIQFLAPLLALQTPATAPASAPSTAPTTTVAAAPSTVPSTAPSLDQSSPKALLRSFFASRGEVDDATIRSLLHASNDLEQKVLDSVVQIELANARLRVAEREKFGVATTAPSVASRFEAASLTELDAFVEKIEGESATVSDPRDPASAMQFVKVEGKWKLPIASLVGKLDPAVAETMGVVARAQIEIIDAVAAEVRAGKWTSEEQVQAELARRLAAKIASTHPATVPVTAPANAASAATAPAAVPATVPAATAPAAVPAK